MIFKVSFLLLSLVVPIFSQDNDAIEFDEVIVTYNQSAKKKLSETVASRYIPMDKSSSNLDISDVIAREPAVSNQKYGGVGSFSTISIRGTEGKRVAVFVDGILQNSAVGGAVNLSRFNGLDIEAIEVYRGVVPAKFGGNSLGGAINIITKNSSKDRAVFSLLLGSFGEFRGLTSLSKQLNDRANIYGSIDYGIAQNNYLYLDRNQTPYNSSDDTLKNLQNNRYFGGTASAGVNIFLPKDRRIKIEWFHNSSSLELPGGEWGKNRTAESTNLEERANIDFSRNFARKTSINQNLTYSYTKDNIFWTSLDHFGVAHGILGDNSFGNLASKDYKLAYILGTEVALTDRIDLSNRFDINTERLKPSSEVEGYIPGLWRTDRVSGSFATDANFTLNAFSATIGGAINGSYNSTEGGIDDYLGDTLDSSSSSSLDWSARVGISQKLFSDKLSLFANVNRYNREPSLTEMYGAHGGILPNVDLLPENGYGFDIGLSTVLDKLSSELIYFYNYRENLIMLLSDGVKGRNDNISATKALGLEQTILFSPLEWLSLEENLTVQHTENLEQMYKGNMLPNEPTFTINGNIGLGSFAGFKLHTIGEYKSFFYRDMANGNRLPDIGSNRNGLFSLSFYLSYNYKAITIEGSLINMLDNRKNSAAYQTTGYSSLIYPGRVAKAQIRYNF